MCATPTIRTPNHSSAPSVAPLALQQAAAEPQEGAPAPKYPKFQLLRQNEDWSAFRGAQVEGRAEITDRVKAITLGEKTWLSIGGHLRGRSENWDNFNFGLPGTVEDDDTFFLYRAFLHGDLHVGDRFRAFLEVKTVHTTDRDLLGGTRTADRDKFDIHQAFVDYTVPTDDGAQVTLRPGRQTLFFGSGRLIGPAPWANVVRSWDGLSVIFDDGPWKTTAFATQFVPWMRDDFDNDPSKGNQLHGVVATRKQDGRVLDLYGLAHLRKNIVFNGTAGNEDRATLGARIGKSRSAEEFDYDLEAAHQFGEVGNNNISAWMLASELGYTITDEGGAPRVWLGLDYASGDGSAGGSVETFSQMFPLGHRYLGFADAIGRQNIFSVQAGTAVALNERVNARASYHVFRKANDSDSLYNIAGAAYIAPGATTSNDAGSEIDLTLRWNADRHRSWLVGYSHYFAGDVQKAAGTVSDIRFFYLSWTYTF